MNWKNIKVSHDWTHFLVDGQLAFDRKYISVLKFHAPGLAPVKDENGWHFIDIEGKTVIPGPFGRAWGFYCDRSAVEDKSGAYHIDPNGNPMYSKRYAWVGNYQENLCAVRDLEGNYMHIRREGEPLCPHSFCYAGDFKDGMACVMLRNGNFKHLNHKGVFIYDAEFVDLGVYHKGYATAKDAKGWFHIDLKGIEVYSDRYKTMEPFYNGVAFAETLKGEKCVVDVTGKKELLN